MLKKILLVAGVGFILGLSLFGGVIGLLTDTLVSVKDTVLYIPLELRVMFFAGWIALFWLLYNAIVS